MTIKCCVCKKTRIDDQWLPLDIVSQHDELVSHSYCPICLDAALTELTAHSSTAGTTSPRQQNSLAIGC